MDLTSLTSLTSLFSGYKMSGWQIAGIIVGALGALGIFFFFNYFKKDAPRKDLVGDLKKFFTMKENFASDLAKIVFYYASIKCFFTACSYVEASIWYAFVSLVGSLVLYRVLYELVDVLIRIWKNGEKK